MLTYVNMSTLLHAGAENIAESKTYHPGMLEPKIPNASSLRQFSLAHAMPAAAHPRAQVPLLDMGRYHKLLAGASWMAEFGDPDTDDWLNFLHKYSPYHNVDPAAAYPPILFTTSTRDDRVPPQPRLSSSRHLIAPHRRIARHLVSLVSPLMASYHQYRLMAAIVPSGPPRPRPEDGEAAQRRLPSRAAGPLLWCAARRRSPAPARPPVPPPRAQAAAGMGVGQRTSRVGTAALRTTSSERSCRRSRTRFSNRSCSCEGK